MRVSNDRGGVKSARDGKDGKSANARCSAGFTGQLCDVQGHERIPQ